MSKTKDTTPTLRRPPSIAPGKMTISCPMGGNGPDVISISLTDESSGCQVVDIRVDPAVFTMAITGCGSQPVTCRWTGGVNHIGKISEHKTEKVWVPDASRKDREQEVAEALAPYEVDGWKGRTSDATNPHRWIPTPDGILDGHHVLVLFVRLIEPIAPPA